MSTDYSAKEKQKAVKGWILYDWANSAFATTVMTAFFPIFFKGYICQGLSVSESTAKLGISNSISALVIAILSPLLGTISDFGSYKKKFIATFCFLGIVMTASLFILQTGDIWLAVILYALANIGFGGSTSFYDALLPSITDKENVDKISTAGYAWGYLGGGVLFTLNVIMSQKPDWFGLANSTEAARWSFLTVSVWWALFSLPLFFWVKEPSAPKNVNSKAVFSTITCGMTELKKTMSNFSNYRSALLFLIAFLFYNDGVGTTIKMSVDYGMSIGFQTSDLIKAILLVQFIGFPAALGFGKIAQYLHPKNGIYICIAIYLLAILWAMRMDQSWEFYVLASMIGIVQGGIQALSRSFFSRLFPKEKAGEFFGFYNLLGKFSGVIGPLLVGWTSVTFNNPRLGILSIVILFIIGAVILNFVPKNTPERTPLL